MAEVGIDISSGRSKSVGEFAGKPFDYLLTVCDNAAEACPVFPGAANRLHWPFEDPAAVEGTQQERESTFRAVRDQIRLKLQEILQ
jgi:arsenate reductase